MRTNLLAVAAFAASIIPAISQEFIDDTALTSTFEDKLGAIAAKGEAMTVGKAQAAMKKVEGRKISIPGKQIETAADNATVSLYESVAPAVVALGTVYKCDECVNWHQGSFSSGWICSVDGLIVTNAHVFEGRAADVAGVMLKDGSVYPIAEMVAADREADVAIFRIDAGKNALPALRTADAASVGEKVHVISHPQGRMWTLTSGEISRFHRQNFMDHGRGTDWMTVTADFACGSSGGPVVNARGEVVGMVSSTTTAYSDSTGCKHKNEPEVQMVFKDCVPFKKLRAMIQPQLRNPARD